MKPNNSLNKREAFTLIELLVVIAIIGILAAMLLPVLSSAKNRAQLTIDRNNHKQIMAGFIMYAGDARDYMPYPGWGTAYPSWCHDAGIPVGGSGTEAGYNMTLPLQIASFKKSLLGPILKDEKIMLCPADKPNRDFWTRNIYITSYVMDGAVSGGYASVNGSTYKISNLKIKVDSIATWETDEKTPFFFNDVSSWPDEGISIRHGKGASVGLIGGGTVGVVYKEWYGNMLAGTPGSHGTAIPTTLLPNRLWYSGSSATGLF
jgi:prepilin-type N-terminal cleavage/methylation domain-containing protein